MLKLLARNVEANLHLFAQDPFSPTSDNSTAAAAAEAAEVLLDDGSNSDSDNSYSAGGAGDAEKSNMRGRDRHGGDRPEQVVAVRKLDWFTFSQEEGPTDNAIGPHVGERKKVRSPSNSSVFCVTVKGAHEPHASGGCRLEVPKRARSRARV